MRIAVGTPLLDFAVFFNFIELISSEKRTLDDLFPEYNGVLPPVEQLYVERPRGNFKTFSGETMIYDDLIFYKRDHIIFGWDQGALIGDPSRLFLLWEPLCLVFDTYKDEWVTVTSNLSRQLGVSRYFPHLVARDEAAARHVLTSNNPVYKTAHIKASKQANDRVDIVEREQDELLAHFRTSMEDSILKIKEEYSGAYNRVFTLHLHQHGEYSIHGPRERHP